MPIESAPPTEARHTCEECGAPLDLQQRYCVRCGTRNRNAASPAAEYFTRSGRRERAAPAAAAAPPRQRRLASSAPALLLALLPVAVGVGVLLGKNGNSNDQQLIDALKNQRPVAASTAAPAAAAAAAGTSHSSVKKGHKSVKAHKSKTLSKTKYGSATQVTGSKPTAQKVQRDTNLVKKLQPQTGRSYLQQQTQGLPDTVVVGK
jgi:hypothetical protein